MHIYARITPRTALDRALQKAEVEAVEIQGVRFIRLSDAARGTRYESQEELDADKANDLRKIAGIAMEIMSLRPPPEVIAE